MKNQTEALEHASVKQYCKAVRVPTVGANFISLAEQAVITSWTNKKRDVALQRDQRRRDPIRLSSSVIPSSLSDVATN